MAHDEFESPVDLPGKDMPGMSGLAWASIVMAVSSLFLLLTNAVAITSWIAEMPASPIQVRALEAAERWEAITEPLGRPRAWLRAHWEELEKMKFDNAPQAAETQRTGAE